MLKIQNLSAGYSDKNILHNINLDIDNNKIIAIVGQSGCGKSTLLKCINKIIYEEQGYIKGEILYNDCNLLSMNNEELRKMVGMVFQNPIAFPVSIKDNLKIVLDYHYNLSKDEANKYIKEALNKVGLYDDLKDRQSESAEKLSGGQLQRLAIARSLCANPQILLLDEPCSALDIASTIEIENLLLELKEEYLIIVVTHNLEQAERIADNIVYINDGRVIEYKEKKDFFDHPDSKEVQQLIEYMK